MGMDFSHCVSVYGYTYIYSKINCKFKGNINQAEKLQCRHVLEVCHSQRLTFVTDYGVDSQKTP
jgi:hypothetical protein